MNKLSKAKRHEKLQDIINDNPFLTDRELADNFNVSVQTIRLDRMELDIPEVRKRIKNMAQSAYKRLKSVNEGEVVGELIKLKLNTYAESYLVTDKRMALQHSNIIRGHHIFAQANSLAVGVIDAELVLTGKVELKFLKPVYIDESIKAKAEVQDIQENKYFINVNTYRKNDHVFKGDFIMFSKPKRGDFD